MQTIVPYPFFIVLSGLTVSKNNLVATIPIWGPSFTVSLDLKINSFEVPNLMSGAWAEVLRFSNTESDQDRSPAIFTHKDGFIRITLEKNGIIFVEDVSIKTNEWYIVSMKILGNNLNLLILKKDEQNLFPADQVFNKEEKISGFFVLEDVKVWAAEGRHGYPPADAQIKNLVYETKNR